jgi:hypothetical protein
MEGMMKPEPWQRLLARAEAAGVSTEGYSPGHVSSRLLESLVDEREAQQAQAQVERGPTRAGALHHMARGNERGKARAISSFLVALGVPRDDTFVQQLDIMSRSMKIFQERNATYGDLWASQPFTDSVNHINSKHKRLEQFAKQLQERAEEGYADDPALLQVALDTALDIINYAAFFARLLTDQTPPQPISAEGEKDA